jgi:hypothetical protein
MAGAYCNLVDARLRYLYKSHFQVHGVAAAAAAAAAAAVVTCWSPQVGILPASNIHSCIYIYYRYLASYFPPNPRSAAAAEPLSHLPFQKRFPTSLFQKRFPTSLLQKRFPTSLFQKRFPASFFQKRFPTSLFRPRLHSQNDWVGPLPIPFVLVSIARAFCSSHDLQFFPLHCRPGCAL